MVVKVTQPVAPFGERSNLNPVSLLELSCHCRPIEEEVIVLVTKLAGADGGGWVLVVPETTLDTAEELMALVA